MKRSLVWVPPTGAAMVRALGSTWRVRSCWPAELDPSREERPQRFVYALWHRTILANAFLFRDQAACIGVSEHDDGELGARMAQHLGFVTARGSSTRGSTRLLRELLRFAKQEHGDVSLTPDGPKGPSQQSKPGVLFVAARLGWPLLPSAIAARPCKTLSSWDRFMIPLPFARVATAGGEPLEVPRKADDAQLEKLCQELDRRMAAAAKLAEEALD